MRFFTALTPRGKHRITATTREDAERMMSSFAGPYEILPGDPGDITFTDVQFLKKEFGEQWEEAAHALGKKLSYLYASE